MAKTNYNKMANKAKEDVKNEVVETSSLEIEQTTNEVEPAIEEPIVEKKPEKKVKKGVVINCSKLNVRTNPHPNAHIELTIDNGTEVIIDRSEGDFYFVHKDNTTEGFNGWCMKKYISVK